MSKRNKPDLYETERVLKKAKFYSKELPLPQGEEYYDDLHDKIMASISTTSIEPLPAFKKEKDLLKRHWRFFSVITMMLALTLVSLKFANGFSSELFQNNHVVKSVQNEDQILALMTNSPEIVPHTILSYKTETDIYSDPKLLEDVSMTKEVFDSL